MLDEKLIPPSEMKWCTFVDGIDFTVLNTSTETGRWVVLFRCKAGSSFPRHHHLGAGEYYVTRGKMTYRMGEAVAGTYGYEPLDAIHELTSFPEDTELLFTNFGPIAFLDEQDGISMILDHQKLREIADAA